MLYYIAIYIDYFGGSWFNGGYIFFIIKQKKSTRGMLLNIKCSPIYIYYLDVSISRARAICSAVGVATSFRE